MFQCPHCHQATLSVWAFLFGSTRVKACPACGGLYRQEEGDLPWLSHERRKALQGLLVMVSMVLVLFVPARSIRVFWVGLAVLLLLVLDWWARKWVKVFQPASRAHQCGPERSVHSLCADDVRQHPIWEGVLNVDAADLPSGLQVYPVSLTQVPALPSVGFLTPESAPDWVASKRTERVLRCVAADATLATGQTCLALVSMYLSDDLDQAAHWVGEIACVFVGNRQIVCDGSISSDQQIHQAVAAQHGDALESVYPVEWRLKVLIEGEDTVREGIEHAWL